MHRAQVRGGGSRLFPHAPRQRLDHRADHESRRDGRTVARARHASKHDDNPYSETLARATEAARSGCATWACANVTYFWI